MKRMLANVVKISYLILFMKHNIHFDVDAVTILVMVTSYIMTHVLESY